MTEREHIGRVSPWEGWDAVYREGRPPWDIGRAQPAFVRLADAGEIGSPVLDAGCGTGENALLLAARGYDVLGVDLSITAVESARSKALDRGLDAEFRVGNVLELGAIHRRFATVIDSGTFHTFSDELRVRYAASLRTVLDPGGVLHLLCFSDRVPGGFGPRRISQAEIRETFSAGWRVDRIEEARFEVEFGEQDGPVHAWLSRVVREV